MNEELILKEANLYRRALCTVKDYLRGRGSMHLTAEEIVGAIIDPALAGHEPQITAALEVARSRLESAKRLFNAPDTERACYELTGCVSHILAHLEKESDPRFKLPKKVTWERPHKNVFGEPCHGGTEDGVECEEEDCNYIGEED